MKKITKTHQPVELKKWREDNALANHTYKDLLGHEAHGKLKEKLLQEQGFICAYTGRCIDDATSHVEHIKPQNECAEWEDVNYRNLVACFPADGGDESHGYGAPVKKGWWEEALFISPLCSDCERKLQFVWSGLVHPILEGDGAATKTIDVLKLNESTLVDRRYKRIKGFFGFSKNFKNGNLSKATARILFDKIYCTNAEGKLSEFCFVLRQLLSKYIQGCKS